jgi:hypothetical protein
VVTLPSNYFQQLARRVIEREFGRLKGRWVLLQEEHVLEYTRLCWEAIETGLGLHNLGRSLVHVWLCSAPLQPSQQRPLLLIFCAHLTCYHSLSRSISHFPRCSHMLSWLCCAHFCTFAALTQGLSAFNSSVCPSGGTVGNTSFCTFQRAHKHSHLTF